MTAVFGVSPAFADGLIGKRLFPSTLTIDDPFVADEVGVVATRTRTGDAGPRPGSLLTDIEGRYSKRITENLGLSFGDGLLDLDRFRSSRRIGGRNPDIEVKYELIESAQHEALLSISLDWQIGGVGGRAIGATAFDVIEPSLFFAKGFGDLPESLPWLRPLAITGRVGVAIPTVATSRIIEGASISTQHNADVLGWGLVIEYSIPYLQEVVRDVGLGAPWNRLIPVMEFDFQTPLDRVRSRVLGTVNPGMVWQVTSAFQVAVEASIPINARSGSDVGVHVGLNVFLNRLAPRSIFGHPVFE